MARPTIKSVKEKLLLGYVLLAVILVGLIWADGFSDRPPPTPAYYRNSYQIDESIYLTLTAEAYDLRLTAVPAATPTPTPGTP